MVLLARTTRLAVLIFLYCAARAGPGVHLGSAQGGTRDGDEGAAVGGNLLPLAKILSRDSIGLNERVAVWTNTSHVYIGRGCERVFRQT